MKLRRGRIGLALGGGGARGWAHIGAIRAIQESGLHVHCVAGTSMGAFVGAAFASGKVDALHQAALDLDWKRLLYYFTGLSSPRTGLIDGARAVKLVTQNVSPVDIGDLPLPFAAVATDILTGDEIVLRKGNVIDAVRASIAIPGLLTPVVHNQRVLVDGGLVNPLPVSVARQLGAARVIAIDITQSSLPLDEEQENVTGAERHLQRLSEQLKRNDNMRQLLDRLNIKMRDISPAKLAAARRKGRNNVPNIFDTFGNSMRIVQRQITDMRLKLEPPDILIQPDLERIRTMDFHRAAEAIDAGYVAAREALDGCA